MCSKLPEPLHVHLHQWDGARRSFHHTDPQLLGTTQAYRYVRVERVEEVVEFCPVDSHLAAMKPKRQVLIANKLASLSKTEERARSELGRDGVWSLVRTACEYWLAPFGFAIREFVDDISNFCDHC
jgi:hypothetical protein